MKSEAARVRKLAVGGIVSLLLLAGCGGGTSPSSINPPVSNGSNSTPTITSISPSCTVPGAAAFVPTINGMNFVATSMVNFGGLAAATTFVNSTQLTAAIPAASIASTDAPAVMVTNPAPGGGSSNASTFTITTGTVDPQSFAYVASSGDVWDIDFGTVVTYAINPTTGILKPTGPIATELSPTSIAIHPSGKFAYVTNSGSNSVSMYSIDSATGALTLIGTIGT
jgi:YVTN family beta-propeller protein